MSDAAPPPERKRRLFFALWPDAAVRQQIARATWPAVRRAGGKPTPAEKLHVTVAFLGAVGEATFARLLALEPPRVGPFELVLDRLQFAGRKRLFWLTCRHLPPPLLALEQGLWQALEPLGFQREPRLFRPHVTLARRARGVDEEIRAIRWPVDALALVESTPDGDSTAYQVVHTWPL